MTTAELNRAATLAGINRESFGDWMNYAARYQRLGFTADAAKCARKALAAYEAFPHLFTINAATLARAQHLAGTAP